jgi:hypothetical protein
MSRIEGCTESHGGLFEHSLLTYYFSYNSQIKCFRTYVDTEIFSCFGIWNSRPKFVLTSQLHAVYVPWRVRDTNQNKYPVRCYKMLSGYNIVINCFTYVSHHSLTRSYLSRVSARISTPFLVVPCSRYLIFYTWSSVLHLNHFAVWVCLKHINH